MTVKTETHIENHMKLIIQDIIMKNSKSIIPDIIYHDSTYSYIISIEELRVENYIPYQNTQTLQMYFS
jgi:hypothetical protein